MTLLDHGRASRLTPGAMAVPRPRPERLLILSELGTPPQAVVAKIIPRCSSSSRSGSPLGMWACASTAARGGLGGSRGGSGPNGAPSAGCSSGSSRDGIGGGTRVMCGCESSPRREQPLQRRFRYFVVAADDLGCRPCSALNSGLECTDKMDWRGWLFSLYVGSA